MKHDKPLSQHSEDPVKDVPPHFACSSAQVTESLVTVPTRRPAATRTQGNLIGVFTCQPSLLRANQKRGNCPLREGPNSQSKTATRPGQPSGGVFVLTLFRGRLVGQA